MLRITVFICLLALVTTVAMADTVTSSYDAGAEKWTYTVTFDDSARDTFRVYLDPNMHIEYLTAISNSQPDYWDSPSSLETDYAWSGITLPYLEWTKSWSYVSPVDFYYSDDHDTTVNDPHMMDLVNHPGPLLYDPAGHASAPSAEILGGATSYLSESGHAVAITPEPATLTLLSLGLMGLAGAARRRRHM